MLLVESKVHDLLLRGVTPGVIGDLGGRGRRRSLDELHGLLRVAQSRSGRASCGGLA